ncbi:hypothetical protein [Cyanobium sp. ATX 6F1]|uniref:hypothetical protein n=1 Tax=unclassified Cyanobium TaxID=2627006 RepID=UPI0020CBF84E|nr:hypothetical protein [Cyanobium sp. ATX 6F1]MCP9915246.1 hypothetical protein [Cyanobium sp. ATX 6F1]
MGWDSTGDSIKGPAGAGGAVGPAGADGAPGAQGPQGIQGEPSGPGQPIFIQAAQPTFGELSGATRYEWWQLLGPDLTCWIEDGT